ncbi:MAG: hypothetical protein PUB76_03505 [Oscillospiraceae bacterium]|nr:hypothetical protein [Oscillospiraceae bacterium]
MFTVLAISSKINPKYFGINPSVKPYGLPAPLSGEPLLIFANFIKKFLFIASPERGGGPPSGGGGVNTRKVRINGVRRWRGLKSVSEADTLIPNSSLLIPH